MSGSSYIPFLALLRASTEMSEASILVSQDEAWPPRWSIMYMETLYGSSPEEQAALQMDRHLSLWCLRTISGSMVLVK